METVILLLFYTALYDPAIMEKCCTYFYLLMEPRVSDSFKVSAEWLDYSCNHYAAAVERKKYTITPLGKCLAVVQPTSSSGFLAKYKQAGSHVGSLTAPNGQC